MAKAKVIEGLEPHAPTGVNARKIAQVRLEELYSWSPYVDSPYSIHELHDMRIAAKRLRYTLEIFQNSLPERCKELVKEVVQIQEELGALHDSDVLIAMLRLCLAARVSGSGYEYALAHAKELHAKGEFTLDPDLVAHLLQHTAAPDARERQGLEALQHTLQHQREQQYLAFREHWSQLQASDFRSELLAALETTA